MGLPPVYPDAKRRPHDWLLSLLNASCLVGGGFVHDATLHQPERVGITPLSRWAHLARSSAGPLASCATSAHSRSTCHRHSSLGISHPHWLSVIPPDDLNRGAAWLHSVGAGYPHHERVADQATALWITPSKVVLSGPWRVLAVVMLQLTGSSSKSSTLLWAVARAAGSTSMPSTCCAPSIAAPIASVPYVMRTAAHSPETLRNSDPLCT